MNQLIATIILSVFMLGCSTVDIPNYIKADHPYVRKVSGDYDSIVSTVKDVLFKENWLIQAELKPSDYERRDGGEDQSRDILLFTEVKEHPKVAYKVYTHMNVFIHATADGAEVDLRYEAINPGVVKLSNTRNDKLAKRILDAIEQQVLEGK